MSSIYSLKHFSRDMKQLGGMIETFYSQNGGRSSSRGGKKRGGESNVRQTNANQSTVRQTNANQSTVRQTNANQSTVRHYKVLTVNGKPYPYYKRYKGAEPKDAAKKAGKFICKKLNMNKNCKITFQLKETTRGSDHRSYGPYKGHWEKLSKPKTLRFPGKKPFTVTHKFMVKLAKKN
jgi:hypothetical protein